MREMVNNVRVLDTPGDVREARAYAESEFRSLLDARKFEKGGFILSLRAIDKWWPADV